MRRLNVNTASLLLLLVGGCSQIIGLGDYEIDTKLDGTTAKAGSDSQGGEVGQGGEVSSGGTESGGKAGSGGTGAVTQGGQGGDRVIEPTAGQAGEPPIGAAGAGGAENPTRVLVPCQDANCCTQAGGVAEGVELLKDGGFELGTLDDGLTPWTESSTNNFEIVTSVADDFGFDPKSGTYYAYLSGLQSERSVLFSEDVTVPPDAGWLVVSGYRLFQIDTQDETNEDYCLIGFFETGVQGALELPFAWGRPSENTDGWGDTATWKRFEASWDAEPHQGGQRYLTLQGESDAYSLDDELTSSAFLFDDVSLKAFRCYKP